MEVDGPAGACPPVCLQQDLFNKGQLAKTLLEKELVKDDVWFVVDKKWFTVFRKYVGLHPNWPTYIGITNPGPVDNSSLLQDKELKSDLEEGIDYMVVPIELWNHFMSWFGIVEGQEPLARKVVESGLFVKHCKIELYPIRLKLCKDFDLSYAQLEHFSKTDDVVDIAEKCRRVYRIEDGTDIRLWSYTSNTFVEIKLTGTIQDEALYSDQVVVVETQREDGSWRRSPKFSAYTDTFVHHVKGDFSEIGSSSSPVAYLTRRRRPHGYKIESPSQPDMRIAENRSMIGVCSGEEPIQSTKEIPGLCGLDNIGNTCFMNSVIQCMSNCPPVTKYFIHDHYLKELNKTNPLGRRGEIASAYGSLIKTMWSGQKKCTAPRNFKIQVGKFAPQFSGTDQNDCQELLTFLLDGLHEDLNRIVVKPYCEQSDSEGRSDEELADEAWRNHLKRNDSIIIDNFHGLLKSTVVCPQCNKSSVTFDPFCYLSLPLPIKNERRIEVTLFPHDSWKTPKAYKVMVPKEGIIHDLLIGLNQLCGLSPDELLVTEVARCRFKKFFLNEDSLTKIGSEDYIVVYEVPNLENHIRIPVCLWEYKKQKFSSNHLFGHPVIVVVPEKTCTAENMYDNVLLKLCRHVTNPTEKGAIDLLQLACKFDDSEMRTSLKSLANSLPRSLFSLHVIEGSTVQDFPDDTVQVSALFSGTLGLRYLAAQWNPENRAEHFNEEILDEIEEHESVSQSETDKISLIDCLNLYSMCEKLGGDDAWYCPACKKHQRASKTIALWRLPAILIIHLKRFAYTRYSRDKINTYVEFPVEELDLSHFIIDTKNPSNKYKLIGVCNHVGALASGHYTAYALNEPTNKWYTFDDKRVSEMASQSVVSNSAYVLFYLKQD